MIPDFKKYVKEGGFRCPYCRSTQIQAGSPDYNTTCIYQDVVCLDCRSEWIDEYTLTNAEAMEDS